MTKTPSTALALPPVIEKTFIEIKKSFEQIVSNTGENAASTLDVRRLLGSLSSNYQQHEMHEAKQFVSVLDNCLQQIENTEIKSDFDKSLNDYYVDSLLKAIEQLITHTAQYQLIDGHKTSIPRLVSSLQVVTNELKIIFDQNADLSEIVAIKKLTGGETEIYKAEDLADIRVYALKNSASIRQILAELESICVGVANEGIASLQDNQELEIAFGQQLATAVNNRFLRDAWLIASEVYRLVRLGEIPAYSTPVLAQINFLKCLASAEINSSIDALKQKLNELVYSVAIECRFERMEYVFSHYGLYQDAEIHSGWLEYIDNSLKLNSPNCYTILHIVHNAKALLADVEQQLETTASSFGGHDAGSHEIDASQLALPEEVLGSIKQLAGVLDFVPLLHQKLELKYKVKQLKNFLASSSAGQQTMTLQNLAEILVAIDALLGSETGTLSVTGSSRMLTVQLCTLLNQIQSMCERGVVLAEQAEKLERSLWLSLRQNIDELASVSEFVQDQRQRAAIQALTDFARSRIQSLDTATQSCAYLAAQAESLQQIINQTLIGASSDRQKALDNFLNELAAPQELPADVTTSAVHQSNPTPSLIDERSTVITEHVSDNVSAGEISDNKPLSADIDEDIADIFLEEAGEILQELEEKKSGWSELIDREGFTGDEFYQELGEIRRHFHTMKGSGRMACAEHIGELSWSIESMLNRVLENSIDFDQRHNTVIWRAVDILPSMTAAFESRMEPVGNYLNIMQEADALREQRDSLETQSALDITSEKQSNILKIDASQKSKDEDLQSEEATQSGAKFADNLAAISSINQNSGFDAPISNAVNDERKLSEDDLMHPGRDDSVFERPAQREAAQIIDSVDPDFLAECQEMFSKLQLAASELERDGQNRSVLNMATLQMHKMLGAAPLSNFPIVGQVARVAEQHLTELLQLEVFPENTADLIRDYHELLKRTVNSGIELESVEGELPQDNDCIREALAIKDQWQQPLYEKANQGPSVRDVLQKSDFLFEIAGVLSDWRTSPVQGKGYDRLLEEIQSLLSADNLPEPIDVLLRALKPCYALLQGRALSFSNYNMLRQAHEDLENQLSALLLDQKPRFSQSAAVLEAFTASKKNVTNEGVQQPSLALVDDAESVEDELHDEIVQLFKEELGDLLEETQRCFSHWSESTSSIEALKAFLRPFHTIKGSARMAAVESIANMAHELETYVESVESGLDDGEAEKVFAEKYKLLEATCQSFIAGNSLSETQKPTKLVERRAKSREVAAESHEMVKVPSNIVDRLNNLADENSISRSVIEQRITDFSDGFEEVDATLNRLREQIRQLDIETEAQISSRKHRVDIDTKEGFDPLEMDSYSKQQQLSRALQESSSDLKDLFGTIRSSVRTIETMLVQQSRITREMQQSLLQTRTVPLSRALIPRMRQTLTGLSEELGKPVSLSVLNVDGQLDKRVLERLVGPIEHVLRNAIDHGLESQQERIQAGKNPSGLICVDISRQGSELHIEIKDDGKGIDVAKVKAKAIERDLISEDENLDDHRIRQLIFEPGFSTAAKLTQISGRGVGLDVVSSELKQLGGQVSVTSEFGSGSTFTLKIPFNVAMNRVLLVGCQGETFAIPLDSLQGIVRVSSFELEEQYQNPEFTFEYAGRQYEFSYLGAALTGDQPQYNLDQYSALPVLLARAGDKLAAFQVDELLGSREIVLKTLGPKFKPVQGIAGATILGDGSVVTILDLPELFASDARKSVHSDPAVIANRKELELVHCRALVVDDSVTVRKVTSRLLERHGVNVTTAKDGLEATEIMESMTPDFVLLDIEMPHLDGFEVLSRMRRSEELQNVPVIMISSRTGQKHRQRAKDNGANAFLGKPYQDAQLCATLITFSERFAELYNAKPDDQFAMASA